MERSVCMHHAEFLATVSPPYNDLTSLYKRIHKIPLDHTYTMVYNGAHIEYSYVTIGHLCTLR